MKTIATLIVLSLTVSVFSGTLIDERYKSKDPFLADKSGFDSLFSNPAGMADQTKIFTFSAEAGTWGKREDYQLFQENIDQINDMASGKNFSQNDVKKIMPVLAKRVDQKILDDLFDGTALAGTTKADILDSGNWDTLSATVTNQDLQTISANAGEEKFQQDLMESFDISFNLESRVLIGTLIRGFGLGLYNNAYMLYSLSALGIEDLIFESGLVAGYGFNIGSFLSLGFSGKFALLVADDPMYPFSVTDDLNNQQIIYGYGWGINAGLILSFFDESLRFGVMFNDIIGNVTDEQDMVSGTLQSFLDGNLNQPSGAYDFSLDMSVGVSWQPNWSVIQPKFSFDFYDLIGYIRGSAGGELNPLEYMYSEELNRFLRRMRVGASLKILGLLDVGLHYYQKNFSVGAGLDIAFFQIYGEFIFDHYFEEIGGNLMIKLKF